VLKGLMLIIPLEGGSFVNYGANVTVF